MEKIFLVETTNALHAVDLASTINDVLKLNFNVEILVLNHIKHRFDGDLNNVKVIDSYFDILKFIIKNKDSTFIFNTISVRNIFPLFIFSLFIKNDYYYLHNLRSWFKRTQKKNIFHSLCSFLSTLLKVTIRKRSKGLFVANENMLRYMINKGESSKHCSIMPFKLRQCDLCLNNSGGVVNFVIPGAVDFTKKDFNILREAFSLIPVSIQSKFRVVLLGKVQSSLERDFCESWRCESSIELVFFNSFIPDDVFKVELRAASVIFGSITVDYVDKYHKEIYGITKDSGVDAQAYSYAKPLVINRDFSVVSDYESSTLYYSDSSDLIKILSYLTDEKFIKSLCDKAISNSDFISLPMLQSRTNNFLRKYNEKNSFN